MKTQECQGATELVKSRLFQKRFLKAKKMALMQLLLKQIYYTSSKKMHDLTTIYTDDLAIQI